MKRYEYTYTRQSYRQLGGDVALEPCPPGDTWELVCAAIAGSQTIVFWWRREKP